MVIINVEILSAKSEKHFEICAIRLNFKKIKNIFKIGFIEK